MSILEKIFMPAPGSTFAAEVDYLFYFITAVCAFFFALIIIGTYYLVKKNLNPGELKKTSSVDGNHTLEVVWTVIPSIILLVFFVWGFTLYMKMSVTPRNALQVKVTGQRWFWTFDYPNGTNSVGEMVVPVDKPVELLISSRDVIHSFFVPGFRVKQDAVPNRYTVAWFESNRIGEYPVYCAEFCGTSHSKMLAKVKVVSQPDYEKWLETSAVAAGGSPVELGAKLYQKNACFTCHSIDGKPLVGPSWKGLFGRQSKFTNGSSIVADENYLRESILNPAAKVLVGFAPVMPTYQGILKDHEIDALIAYIKTLK